MYRGMPFNVAGLFPSSPQGKPPLYASARDFGNVAAGYVAGNRGLSWEEARFGFDALESQQKGKLVREGQGTQLAERIGWETGKLGKDLEDLRSDK
jgi:hypothetical protein